MLFENRVNTMKLLSISVLAVISTASVQAGIYEPAPYRLTDGISIVPQLNTVVYSNDNIYTLETDPISSMIYVVEPSITFGTDDGINQYGGSYDLTAGSYSEDSDSNYVDHDLVFTAHTEFTDKHRMDLKLGFGNLHDDREDLDTYDEPLKYNEYAAKAYYQYGSKSALINIGGGAQYDRTEYQNFTDEKMYDDASTVTFMLDGSYRIGPSTQLTADLSLADITYLHNEISTETDDNTDSEVLFGVRWNGVSDTVGKIKFGYQFKDFDDVNTDDFSGNTINLALLWKPLERTSLEVSVSRDAEDTTTDDADYVLALSGSLALKHEWSSQLNSKLYLGYANSEYVGSSSNREDDTLNTSIDFTYDLARWISVTVGYEYTDRASTQSYSEYTQNLFNLGVAFSL